jgi:hypothetical protein
MIIIITITATTTTTPKIPQNAPNRVELGMN